MLVKMATIRSSVSVTGWSDPGRSRRPGNETSMRSASRSRPSRSSSRAARRSPTAAPRAWRTSLVRWPTRRTDPPSPRAPGPGDAQLAPVGKGLADLEVVLNRGLDGGDGLLHVIQRKPLERFERRRQPFGQSPDRLAQFAEGGLHLFDG